MKTIIFFLSIIFSIIAFAQNNQIAGQVLLANSGRQGVKNCKVWAIGSDTVWTDFKGNFVLTFVEDLPIGVIPVVKLQKENHIPIHHSSQIGDSYELMFPQLPKNNFLQISMGVDSNYSDNVLKLYDYTTAHFSRIEEKYANQEEYVGQKDFDEADQQFLTLIMHGRQGLQDVNLDVVANNTKEAYEYIFAGKYRDALQILTAELESHINLLTTARLYCMLGELEKAITSYQKAISHTPNNFEAYFELAWLLDSLNKCKQARKVEEQMLEQLSDNKYKANMLINFGFWSCNNDKILGKKLIERGLQLHKNLIYQYPTFYELDEAYESHLLQIASSYSSLITSTSRDMQKIAEGYLAVYEPMLFTARIKFEESPSVVTAQKVAKYLGWIGHNLYWVNHIYCDNCDPFEVLEIYREAIELYEEYAFDTAFDPLLNEIAVWEKRVKELQE
ncbi:MAG: tetratricopeptide repeat protein [Bacteroidota bacterium]